MTREEMITALNVALDFHNGTSSDRAITRAEITAVLASLQASPAPVDLVALVQALQRAKFAEDEIAAEAALLAWRPTATAQPAADTRKECTCLGTCNGADRLGPGWRCVLSARPTATGEPSPVTPDTVSPDFVAMAQRFVTLANTVWTRDRDGRAASRLAEEAMKRLAHAIMTYPATATGEPMPTSAEIDAHVTFPGPLP